MKKIKIFITSTAIVISLLVMGPMKVSAVSLDNYGLIPYTVQEMQLLQEDPVTTIVYDSRTELNKFRGPVMPTDYYLTYNTRVTCKGSGVFQTDQYNCYVTLAYNVNFYANGTIKSFGAITLVSFTHPTPGVGASFSKPSYSISKVTTTKFKVNASTTLTFSGYYKFSGSVSIQS